MDTKPSFIEFLTEVEYQEKAQAMINNIAAEASALNRPIYFGDGKFCYEQWANGKKYVLLTDDVTVS